MASHAKSASIEPKRLASGNYADVCPDCDTRIVASTPDDVDGAHCACPPQRYEYLLVLVCLLCSHPVTSVRVPTPRTRIVLLRPIRCSICGGQTVVSGDVERVAIPAVIKWQTDAPRRGRPPKWLQELRRSA